MNQVVNAIRTFVQSEDGPTSVEYGVLLGLIVVALLAAIPTLTAAITGLFGRVAADVDAIAP